MNCKVVISGIGHISSLGRTSEQIDNSLEKMRSGVIAFAIDLDGIDPVQVPICPSEFDASKLLAPSKVPMDRNTAMALDVAMQASNQANLHLGDLDLERVGVFWGSGMGGAHTFDQTCYALYAKHKRIRPTNIVTVMPNAPSAEIALWLKARGMCLTFACACASSSVAMGEALYAIRSGRIDLALVGGSESMLSSGVIASWSAMRVLAQINDKAEAACKPFDAFRTGFALGEGAAAFVLESERHALKRGVKPLALLSGYATNSDGSHFTHPNVDGQVKAMRLALEDAGLTPKDIGYINAHGTATVTGDLVEAASISKVFGEMSVPVGSTKGLHGHLLGAGGALEFSIAIRALEKKRLPGSANLDTPDPSIHLNLIPRDGLQVESLRHVMSNSFAFGGTNAVLIGSSY